MKKHNLHLPVKFCLLLFFLLNYLSSKGQLSKVHDMAKKELQREFSILKNEEVPAYYLSYNIHYGKSYVLNSVNGKLKRNYWDVLMERQSQKGVISCIIRVGSPKLDNTRGTFHYGSRYNYGSYIPFSLEDSISAIQKQLWYATHENYNDAVEKYKEILAEQTKSKSEKKEIPDFRLSENCDIYFGDTLGFNKVTFDKNKWETRLNSITSIALEEETEITISARIEKNYRFNTFIISEGCDITHVNLISELYFIVNCEDIDGNPIQLYKSYSESSDEYLPQQGVMLKDVKELVEKIKRLRKAPLAKAYSAPAIISGSASGVYFHEILGHRIEAHRLKEETDQQTFLDRLGKQVIPDFISVDMDPTLQRYENHFLSGNYIYDDEGIKGQKVEVIKNGVLNSFLHSRKPLDETSKSNGHGRSSMSSVAVARQSNMIVKTATKLTNEQLRNELIKLIKDQKKEYGFFIEQVAGGHTQTDVRETNVFELIPSLVYKVFPDGRPDELLRGVRFVGTPLLMFEQLYKAGGKEELFSGKCGAESGWVPVSTISPSFLLKSVEIQRAPDSEKEPAILINPKKLKRKNEKI